MESAWILSPSLSLPFRIIPVTFPDVSRRMPLPSSLPCISVDSTSYSVSAADSFSDTEVTIPYTTASLSPAGLPIAITRSLCDGLCVSVRSDTSISSMVFSSRRLFFTVATASSVSSSPLQISPDTVVPSAKVICSSCRFSSSSS